MQAQYHPGPLPEADITATPAEFAAMAGRVAELAAAGSGEVAFPATRVSRSSIEFTYPTSITTRKPIVSDAESGAWPRRAALRQSIGSIP